jgi:outer membrane immunogenic protein
LALFVSVAALCDPGQAADLGGAPRRAPPPPPPVVEAPLIEAGPPIWNGVYVGISGGYGWESTDLSYEGGVVSTDPPGVLGSVTAGYNYMVANSFLVGVEGDIGLMDRSADNQEVLDNHILKSQFGPVCSTLRARAGLLPGERTLFYGTGGIAIAEVDEHAPGHGGGDSV